MLVACVSHLDDDSVYEVPVTASEDAIEEAKGVGEELVNELRLHFGCKLLKEGVLFEDLVIVMTERRFQLVAHIVVKFARHAHPVEARSVV